MALEADEFAIRDLYQRAMALRTGESGCFTQAHYAFLQRIVFERNPSFYFQRFWCGDSSVSATGTPVKLHGRARKSWSQMITIDAAANRRAWIRAGVKNGRIMALSRNFGDSFGKILPQTRLELKYTKAKATNPKSR